MANTLMTIQQILKNLNITQYTINYDRSVTVHQNVNILNKQLTKIPVKFKEIKGDFICSHNNLTSLINAPHKIEGWFSCSHNQLTNLEGAPQIVKRWFSCSYNLLTSLKGIPPKIRGSFYCSHNQLINLDGLPIINGDINCDSYLHEDINYQRHLLKKQIRDIE